MARGDAVISQTFVMLRMQHWHSHHSVLWSRSRLQLCMHRMLNTSTAHARSIAACKVVCPANHMPYPNTILMRRKICSCHPVSTERSTSALPYRSSLGMPVCFSRKMVVPVSGSSSAIVTWLHERANVSKGALELLGSCGVGNSDVELQALVDMPIQIDWRQSSSGHRHICWHR
jgi:hypothetical protein